MVWWRNVPNSVCVCQKKGGPSLQSWHYTLVLSLIKPRIYELHSQKHTLALFLKFRENVAFFSRNFFFVLLCFFCVLIATATVNSSLEMLGSREVRERDRHRQKDRVNWLKLLLNFVISLLQS